MRKLIQREKANKTIDLLYTRENDEELKVRSQNRLLFHSEFVKQTVIS